MNSLNPQPIAYALLRIALGLNIFIHGAGRLGASYQKFVEATIALFKDSPLPDFAVQSFAHCIPPLELVFGILILLGIFTLPALIGGTLFMIGLMAGMCVLQKWEIVGIQMIYIFLFAVLVFTIHYNSFSVDRLFSKKER
jgi:thiosulfate dehydrogenase [quinone] large subunit